MFLAESTGKLKSEFLAKMSHGLRTPLNAIIGFSEAMLSGVYGPVDERHREHLGDILASGKNLLGLINDILDLKEDRGWVHRSGAKDVFPERTHEICSGNVQGKGHPLNITLECDVEDGVDEIVADQRKVKQVMVNLLSNAIKFTRLAEPCV